MNPAFSSAAPRKARVEIIPLIDVVFFLLATFVLFTLARERIHSLPAKLPVSGEPLTGEDTTVYLTTSEPGVFFWKLGRDGIPEQLATAELLPRLESYKRFVATPRVLVSGDERAKFGATIVALDELRKAKITDVALETSPR